jgi:hypothetical protein
MRRTVHLLTADDVIAWRSRHDAMLRQRVLGTYRRELDGVDLEATAAAAREVMSDGQPRTAAELVQAMNRPDVPARALSELLIAALVPVVQAPPRGLWRGKGGVRNVLITHWLGRELDPPTDGQELVLRYLKAFGPAATADIRAWSGLAGLPAAVKAVRPQLMTFKDEHGRELLDLPDAPRPDPDTPAPVRFLPAFDNALLGYDDRGRIVDDQHRYLSVAGERVVLVDGRVAATWTAADGKVAVTPLRPFSRKEKVTVQAEADQLADFLTRPETPVAATAPGPSGSARTGPARRRQ